MIKVSDFNNLNITETIVIKRILLGEKELFEILLRRNNQKLYRVIRSYLNDIQEIEDIMQNTYLKAFEKLGQFNHASQFSTWLIRIGINETLYRLKEKAKFSDLGNQNSKNSNHRILEIPTINSLHTENNIISEETKQFIEKLIDSLDSKYRVVYIMKEIEGMRIKEIAKCLKISIPNVKIRLHRARKMLKEKLWKVTSKKNIFEFGDCRCDYITEKVIGKVLSN